VWVCFSRVGLGPFVPVKGTLNALSYQEILDNFMLTNLWEQFGDDSVLFQSDCTPVHKARSIKTWLSEFGVDELYSLAQSPDLNPIEHLWDELGDCEPDLLVQHHCLVSQMRFLKNGQKFP